MYVKGLEQCLGHHKHTPARSRILIHLYLHNHCEVTLSLLEHAEGFFQQEEKSLKAVSNTFLFCCVF